MAKKRSETQLRLEEIIQRSMEEVMHASMMPYSEYVILERALPRVEDGLKPVQRRILFTMHELGLTADKPHKKCARIVGDCLGKYHPHGDTSVYDALARMAQPFVMRGMLVDGHGNFGSIDGDSPAAMRYTEARMTPLAMELLRDIDKDAVGFHLNYDDSQKEPDTLPGIFPNLLVNGASGIAVGLATNIPPHNLGEVIDGAIAMIDNPAITTRELMRYIPAPDFPTGGILAADEELASAYETGRGKCAVRAKVHFEDGSAGRKLLVISELPYQVGKAVLLEKILKLSEEKKALFAGIHDIRDESDRTGMRAVIEIKRDADPEKLLAALYKYSDLQINFGLNMVAIAEGKPMQLGLKAILRYFLAHRKDVVTRRTQYELAQAKARAHILEGLIIAVDNLDEVIRIIRSSKNPKEARERLMARFALSETQAQAILDMRLQRLTNLEIVTLREDFARTNALIEKLEAILASEKKLFKVIKGELTELRGKYADPRRTALTGSFEVVEVKPEAEIAEEMMVLYTRAGFIKRMPLRAYERSAAAGEELDAAVALRTMTDRRLMFFTNQGNLFTIPVTQAPECRPKDRGLPPGGLLAGIEKDEKIVAVFAPEDYSGDLLFATARGMVKRTAFQEYDARKGKLVAVGLKSGDELVSVQRLSAGRVLLVTREGMAIHFAAEDVPTQGRAATGVKGIALAPGDRVLAALLHDDAGEMLLCTDRGYMKRCLIVDFDRQARGGKGLKAVSFQKNGATGTCVAAALMVTQPYDFIVRQNSGTVSRMNTEDVRLDARAGKGYLYAVVVMDDVVVELAPA